MSGILSDYKILFIPLRDLNIQFSYLEITKWLRLCITWIILNYRHKPGERLVRLSGTIGRYISCWAVSTLYNKDSSEENCLRFRNSSRDQKDLLMSELLTKYFVFGIRECGVDGDRLRRKCSRSDVKALLFSNLILCRKVTRLLGRADAASGTFPLNGARLHNCNGNLRWIK